MAYVKGLMVRVGSQCYMRLKLCFVCTLLQKRAVKYMVVCCGDDGDQMIHDICRNPRHLCISESFCGRFYYVY